MRPPADPPWGRSLSRARPFGSTPFSVPLFRIKAFGWLCADYSEDHLVGKTTRKRQNRRLGAGRFLERVERHDFDLFQVLMTWGFANRESATCDAGQARGRFRTSLPAPYRQFERFCLKFSTRCIFFSSQERCRNDVFGLAHSWESQLCAVGIASMVYGRRGERGLSARDAWPGLGASASELLREHRNVTLQACVPHAPQRCHPYSFSRSHQ